MSIAHFSPFPYIVLFIAIIFIFMASIVKFPSLKRRSKRNLLIYLLVALMLSLTAYQAYNAFLGPAIVSYSVVTDGDQFYANQTNQFNVSCSNLGRRPTSFDLLITAVNASFISNSQDYMQINSTAIKLPFSFNWVHEGQSKIVEFRINENVTGCDFNLSIEGPGGPIDTESTSKIHGDWNSTSGCYFVGAEFTPCM